MVGAALIGVGGQGPGTYNQIVESFQGIGVGVTKLAECDVKWLDRADNKTTCTDFRRVLERKDIEGRDAGAIAQDLTSAFDTYCGQPA